MRGDQRREGPLRGTVKSVRKVFKVSMRIETFDKHDKDFMQNFEIEKSLVYTREYRQGK